MFSSSSRYQAVVVPNPDEHPMKNFTAWLSVGKGPVTRIGNYELVDHIGPGGMGVVFKAKQVGLDRFVALKVMNTEAVPKRSQAIVKQRFVNEAKAMSRLDHPNIISIYEVGEHLGVCFFSMKFIAGGSLSDRMERFTRRFAAIPGFIGSVALALDHAHRHGVIHRDLNPQNILLDADKPIVTDFGLAKLQPEEKELTKLGEILGTPHYMARRIKKCKRAGRHLQSGRDIVSINYRSTPVCRTDRSRGNPQGARAEPSAAVFAES
jgi:serine/threonine protein kinase